MGAALERLGAADCARIIGELIDLTGKTSGDRLGAFCPWHKESTPGAFWYDPEKDYARCYGCENHGDLIDVFCAVQGLSESDGFRAFFERFPPRGSWAPRAVTPSARGEKKKGWECRKVAPAEASWREGATAWVDKCAGRLCAADLDRLASWGVTPETAQRFRIGSQPEDRFIPFTRWGLPYAENANGRERHILLPAGLVFPVFDAAGELLRVKVRLANPKDDEPKYKAIVGGVPACYGIFGSADSAVWIIVETERDGMMLAHALEPWGIGAMAVGTASLAPDDAAHALLSRCECILNALDNDHAGAAASWGFDPDASMFRWNLAYPHAVRWPVPVEMGKDPADLVGKLPVAEWALAGLPRHVLRQCENRWSRYRRTVPNEVTI